MMGMLSVIAGINSVVDLIVGVGVGVGVIRVGFVVVDTISVENTLHPKRNGGLPVVAGMASV
jgi:hypothetical protein